MKSTFLTLALIFSSLNSFSQSVFRLDANGFGVPQFATNPTCAVADKGKLIYNTTQEKVLYCNGATWIDPATGGVPNNWINSGTNSYLSSLTGRVGIGTNNPVSTLTLYHPTSPSTNYQTSTTGSTNQDGFFVGISNGDSYVFNYENSDLIFATNATQRLIITDSGNVGIGNLTPSQKLDVAGNTKIDGSLTVNNGKGIVRSDDATQMIIEDYVTPSNINFTLTSGAILGPLAITFSNIYTSTPSVSFGDTNGMTNPQNLVFTIESVSTTGANIWIRNIGTTTSVGSNSSFKAMIIGKK